MRALVLPIIVPMSTAAIMLLAPRRPLLQRWIGLAGAIALLASTVAVFIASIARHPGPASRWMAGAVRYHARCGSAGGALTRRRRHRRRSPLPARRSPESIPRREAIGYHPLIQILLMGVSGAFLTGDFFNLYVWFEVMLVASFVLMALHRNRAQLDAAFKYVTINLIASSMFLTALGLLYGVAGTLNMADLARTWPAVQQHRHGYSARGAVHDRVQHQGRTVSAVFLAARLLSHAARRGRRRVCRTADESGRVRALAHLHVTVPGRAIRCCPRCCWRCRPPRW